MCTCSFIYQCVHQTYCTCIHVIRMCFPTISKKWLGEKAYKDMIKVFLKVINKLKRFVLYVVVHIIPCE